MLNLNLEFFCPPMADTIVNGSVAGIKSRILTAIIVMLQSIFGLSWSAKIAEVCKFRNLLKFFTSTVYGEDIYIVGTSVLVLMFIILLFKVANDTIQTDKNKKAYKWAALVCKWLWRIQACLLIFHTCNLFYGGSENDFVINVQHKNVEYFAAASKGTNNAYLSCEENTKFMVPILGAMMIYNILRAANKSKDKKKIRAIAMFFFSFFFEVVVGFIPFNVLNSLAPVLRALQAIAFYYLAEIFEDKYEKIWLVTAFEFVQGKFSCVSSKVSSLRSRLSLLCSKISSFVLRPLSSILRPLSSILSIFSFKKMSSNK